jgi:hypothetical protein
MKTNARRSGSSLRFGVAFIILASVVPVSTVLGGCTEPLSAPSAYSEQRYLCDSLEWNKLIEECAATFARDGKCRGHVGLRGRLQGTDVVVQSRVNGVSIATAESDGPSGSLAGFSADGVSPYFAFQLEAKAVGGSVHTPAPEPRTLRFRDERRGTDQYTDEFVELALRLTAGGESANFRAVSGSMTLSVPQPDVVRGTFRGTFTNAGDAEGCFVIFFERSHDDHHGDNAVPANPDAG